MKQIAIRVEGMKCTMCENHICEHIRNRYAVKKVTASRKKAEVIILTERDFDQQELISSIASLGYTASSCSVQSYQPKKWPWSRL